MSLAIPYVLDAAAETAPGAVVRVAHRDLTAAELGRRTVAGAERCLAEGMMPGDRIPLPPLDAVDGIVDALAAARIGLVLCEGSAAGNGSATGDGSLRAEAAHGDRDVAESRVWSETPVAIVGGRTLTHGDVIGLAGRADDPGPEALRPLPAVLRSIATAMGPGDVTR